jgi:hypothetical protein
MSIKDIYKDKTVVTETPPPWVWKVCSRTVSVPEFIEQRAKGRMKLERGKLFEQAEITWEEYRKSLASILRENENNARVDIKNLPYVHKP